MGISSGAGLLVSQLLGLSESMPCSLLVSCRGDSLSILMATALDQVTFSDRKDDDDVCILYYTAYIVCSGLQVVFKLLLSLVVQLLHLETCGLHL